MISYNILKIVEDNRTIAYDCSRGYRTVGLGFNMDNPKSKEIWNKLSIKEDFNSIYNKQEELSKESSIKLFKHIWNWCEKATRRRCNDLNINFDDLREFHKYILLDIAYNTGSLRSWKQVFIKDNPNDILFEARRNPKEMMDSRVAKIGYQFGIVNSIKDCKDIGIIYAKYLK